MTTKKSRTWDSVEPPLSPWILSAVHAMGFSNMTPVQASTIPLFIGYKDVVVEAVTGSGKTLSFLIPVVERVLRLEGPTKRHHVASLIIAPTRELAVQIETVLRSLIAFHPQSAICQSDPQTSLEANEINNLEMVPSSHRIVSQLLVSGLRSPQQDLQHFIEYSPNVLIGTPGRLLELLSSPRVRCPQSSFETLVLDEADRLLDLGFKDDLQRIIRHLPKQRRTGLFSASISEALDQLIRVGLRNPVKIAVKVRDSNGELNQRTPTSLQMSYVVASPSAKLPALLQILENMQPMPLKCIIYVSTCATVDYFQHILSPLLLQRERSFLTVPLHGKHTPKVRQKNFDLFAETTSPSVLLTTDVAARGLDIPQVDFVAQIDPPLDPKVFLHRCGRAGRAGRRGVSVVFLRPGKEEDYVHFLKVRKTPITRLQVPEVQVASTEATDLSRKIRDIVKTDRAIHEKAQRGFVSWVQAYRKHQARSIFQVSDLDWADLANSWGLLKMPKMPELRAWGGDHGLGLAIDFDSYKYRDKQREKRRQQVANSKEIDDGASGSKVSVPSKRPWSDNINQKEARVRRQAQKKAKKEYAAWEKMSIQEREQQMELETLIKKAKQQHLVENEPFEGFDE